MTEDKGAAECTIKIGKRVREGDLVTAAITIGRIHKDLLGGAECNMERLTLLVQACIAFLSDIIQPSPVAEEATKTPESKGKSKIVT